MNPVDQVKEVSPLTVDVEQKPVVADKKVSLFGCKIWSLTLEETVQRVHAIIADGRPHQHCVVNAGKLVLMHREPELKQIVHSCSLINADGQSVVWALQLLGRPIPERVTGIDLMERLLIEADKNKYGIYFLGATQEVSDKVVQKVKRLYPNIRVAGQHHGFFSEQEEEGIVENMSESNADILFVAMGSPKKEYWLAKNIQKANIPFCMGVGGSFDVFVGKAKRAPRWIQNIGMEWFFRFIQDPFRLWRRYLIDNFVFIYLLFMAFIKQRPSLERKKAKDLEKKEIT